MDKKILAAAIAMASVVFTLSAHADEYDQNSTEPWRGCYRGARTPAQVRNYENVVIIAKDGKKPTVEQVEQAIVKAGKLQKWTITRLAQGKAAGKMEASLLVRNKHTIVVEIVYDPEKYSIHYKNSNNMNAAFCEGKYYIHPNYNVWTSRLNDEIQAQLDTL